MTRPLTGGRETDQKPTRTLTSIWLHVLGSYYTLMYTLIRTHSLTYALPLIQTLAYAHLLSHTPPLSHLPQYGHSHTYTVTYMTPPHTHPLSRPLTHILSPTPPLSHKHDSDLAYMTPPRQRRSAANIKKHALIAGNSHPLL